MYDEKYPTTTQHPRSHQSVYLLRSPEWIADYGAHVGGTVWLNMPEMGACGEAEVLDIGPAQVYDVRPGLVTGTFRHTSGEVYDLKLESESKPIGVTGSHPFWSVSRGSWVSVLDLQIGETLKTLEGTTVVESLERRSEPEAVYNIEVEGDHVYRVGESGVLVHNASIKPEQISNDSSGSQYGKRAYAFRRSQKVQKPWMIAGKGNLGILYYREPAQGKSWYLGTNTADKITQVKPVVGHDASGVDEGDAAIASTHSEQLLIQNLEGKAPNADAARCKFEILAIFSERSSCSKCEDFLKEQMPKWNMTFDTKKVPIYYVVPLDNGSGKQLMEKYKEIYPLG